MISSAPILAGFPARHRERDPRQAMGGMGSAPPEDFVKAAILIPFLKFS
jgi:hypothetical protein